MRPMVTETLNYVNNICMSTHSNADASNWSNANAIIQDRIQMQICICFHFMELHRFHNH